MSRYTTMALTALAMLAFAGNSLLCRQALHGTGIDPASFTVLRLLAGAVMLWLVMRFRAPAAGAAGTRGSWTSALALFTYAAGFSYAYLSLTAATGALLLFAAVQATMTGHGLWQGERLGWQPSLGLCIACGGLLLLLMPGLSAPPLAGAVLMMAAGAAWGIYSLRGRGTGDPTAATAGNFLRTVPFALLLAMLATPWRSLDAAGVAYALASGALTSGLGYALWYRALPALRATSAATVQLSVPALAAAGGVVLLGEPLSPRLVFASAAILGGIALVTLNRRAGTAKAQMASAPRH